MSDAAGERALEAMAALDINRYSCEMLLPAIWRLRDNLTAYDAAFAALAAVLDAPLITLDQRLAQAPLLLGAVRIDLIE